MADKAGFAYIGSWGYDVNAPEHGFTMWRTDGGGSLEPFGESFKDIRVGGPCLHPALDVLYVPDERAEVWPDGGSQLLAVRLDRESGAMTELNRVPSYGNAPAYCAVDGSGKYLLAANHGMNGMITCTERGSGGFRIRRRYDEANIALFRLNEDGSIGEVCDIWVAEGSGPLKSQKSAHPHSIMASPSGDVFVAGDLGADRVYSFVLDRKNGKLRKVSEYAATPGSSPRYCAFHPTRPLVFVNYETRPFLAVFRYKETGELEHLGDRYAFEETGRTTAAASDIRLHPSGNFLYNLDRERSEITVFAVREEDGALTAVQTVRAAGEWPKGCAVSLDGAYFYLCAKRSGFTSLYEIDTDGRLFDTGKRFPQPNPANVTFFPR